MWNLWTEGLVFNVFIIYWTCGIYVSTNASLFRVFMPYKNMCRVTLVHFDYNINTFFLVLPEVKSHNRQDLCLLNKSMHPILRSFRLRISIGTCKALFNSGILFFNSWNSVRLEGSITLGVSTERKNETSWWSLIVHFV